MSNSTTPPIPTSPVWRKLWARLIDAPKGAERTEFARYSQAILELADIGTISRQVAALSIAKVYGIARYDDSDQMEEIMQLALQLEVNTAPSDASWQQL